ncbi:MAG TPA: glycosyltransferase family 2 protein [Actinomycetota bacterium]|nr:glycosyltransferase family 2 protein [Actinomycetota bacterium]
MSGPSISVLMPSYNFARFLRDAIESVLRQEGVEVELIVQDGASTDETVDVLKSYEGRIDWVSEPDRGQADALNRALRRANGDWIAWLNVDEFYLPGVLARLLEAAERNAADFVYGDAVFVDAQGRIMRLLPQHRFSPTVLKHYGTYISTCACLFRRDILDAEPWDASINRVMDWDLYLNLHRAGRRFVYEPLPVAGFRVHDAQITAQPRKDAIPIYEALLAKHGIRRTRFSQARGYLTHALLKATAGSYGRQRCVARLQGRELAWFDGPNPTVGAIERCYAKRP